MNPQQENFVVGPLQSLLAECHTNVLLALRLVEGINDFPPPTPEEQQLIQMTFGRQADAFEHDRERFKRWILLKGFGDVHKAIRTGFERLLLLQSMKEKLKADPTCDVKVEEQHLSKEIASNHFPVLLDRVEARIDNPLEYRKHVESFNCVRNTLEHANGIVTPGRLCNDGAKTKVTLYGQRFRFFFKNDDVDVPAELGKAGPENAALMLGAEPFELTFHEGEQIDLSLKQFIDVLYTCTFIRAEIALAIK